MRQIFLRKIRQRIQKMTLMRNLQTDKVSEALLLTGSNHARNLGSDADSIQCLAGPPAVSDKNAHCLPVSSASVWSLARSIDLIVRCIGVDAHLELSAHVLCHTCLTNLVRRGNDLVLVTEIAGHKRLETTRRYSLPSVEDRDEAMEGLQVDY